MGYAQPIIPPSESQNEKKGNYRIVDVTTPAYRRGKIKKSEIGK